MFATRRTGAAPSLTLGQGWRASATQIFLDKFAPEDVGGDLSIYRADPVGYARDVLGVTLTDVQAEMLASLVENRRTAVKASHAIGKTFCAAVAASWWYDCWEQHIVYISAPTWPQCLGLTFKEIKRRRRRLDLPGIILETGMVKDPSEVLAPGHFIRALNAESGEGFQGEHTAPILIIFEEAVGIPMYMWDAATGLMTHPDCRMLAIANPTAEDNGFGELCGPKGGANVISVKALDHPNIEAELACLEPPFPDAVRLEWLYEELKRECEITDEEGGDAFEFWSLAAIEAALEGTPITAQSERDFYLPNAVFQGRVLGEFPSQASSQVVPSGWLRALPVGLVPSHPPVIGCDVARHGDDRTVIVCRCGPVILFIREVRRLDTMAVTGALIEAARRAVELWGSGNVKKVPILIDVTGGLGAGPYDRLIEQGYTAHGVNNSTKARDEDAYPNKRSELWFVARERVYSKRLDLSLIPEPMRSQLVKELATPTWKNDSAGRRVVETKADIKKRLKASPDLADALCLACYDAGDWAQASEVYSERKRSEFAEVTVW